MQIRFTDKSIPGDDGWVFALLPSLNAGGDADCVWVELFWLTFYVQLYWGSE